jgi:glutamyl-tRNA synthetase
VVRQSSRSPAYRQALERLAAVGRVFPCWCSRAEVARAASAPHLGEEGPVYPGTCRAAPAPRPGRSPALRFAVRPGVVSFHDRLHGPCRQDVAEAVGDFVLQRADGVASYQLAVVVDDAAAGVTDVLRADDLLGSTARQLQLLEALALPAPAYAHVPLLVDAAGQRLAKRDGPLTLAALRARGVRPQAVVGLLARWSGLADGGPVTPAELVAEFRLERLARGPATVTAADLMGLG